MPVPSFVVSAFTDRPFSGNPAAVCLLDQPRPDTWLQAVAADFNLSETAFLVPVADACWQLRWFTPTAEVDLCGHATLASAHVLWQEQDITADTLAFDTRSGLLSARRDSDMIALDFPAAQVQPVTLQPDWQDAVQGRAVQAARGGQDLLLELQSAQQVRDFIPDLAVIRHLPCRGLIITARDTSSDDSIDGADFVSRFFAPKVGVDEDPVTGSAHCILGPYWGKRLGKTSLRGHQVSKRGGFVGVTLRGERLDLTGTAITTLRGTLHVD